MTEKDRPTQTDSALRTSRQPDRDASRVRFLVEAAAGPTWPIDPDVRRALRARFDYDFGAIRVHAGASSASAARSIGARAYTLGNDIHLGAEAALLQGSDRRRLLVHEAVHTVQQGGVTVPPRPGLELSQPGDSAEVEAAHIADSVEPRSARPRSRSMAVRDQVRAATGQTISRSVGPRLQRDLTGKHPVDDGEFDLNLTTQSHPGDKSGMYGTIKFLPNAKAPDSTSIRILQVARVEELSTGKEHMWTGDEKARNKVMTAAEPGVQPGFFVDVLYKNRAPRKKKAAATISPYYIDDYVALGLPVMKDGSKKGKAVSEASIRDYPGSTGKMRFSFETVAKASDTGHVYGTVMWGFSLTDPDKGTVSGERAVGRNVTLKTTDLAIKKFDKFFRNPGASTAP